LNLKKKDEKSNLKDVLDEIKKDIIEQGEHIVIALQSNIPRYIQRQLNKKESKPVHCRYTCDGCQKGPIEGIRYHCTVCEDFDYCEDCEAKLGDEHNHPLLKVRKPKIAPINIKVKLRNENPEIKVQSNVPKETNPLQFLKDLLCGKTSTEVPKVPEVPEFSKELKQIRQEFQVPEIEDGQILALLKLTNGNIDETLQLLFSG